MTRLTVWPVAAILALVAIAGCIEAPQAENVPAAGVRQIVRPVVLKTLDTVENVMTFTQSVVTPAQGVAADLYEPTMEVSETGVIYVAGHVIGAATTGTPAYYSNDDGKTWEVLPFAASLQSPPPVQGSQPPPGDEGFIVHGENKQVWMADIYAAGFSVSGWCNDGAELCYDNRYAYDRTQSTSTFCGAPGADTATAASLNDRPWAAYGGGKLLLVNNPGGGPMQIGAMDVPPATPVGLFDPITGPVWNLCATDGGSIPGIPAMRPDGFFAVPQMSGGGENSGLRIVTGNAANVQQVTVTEAFKITSSGSGTSNGGRTAFDAEGNLFVGARNNTRPDNVTGDSEGRFILAASSDDGATFTNMTFVTGTPVRSLYLDSNEYGPGALLTWSQINADNRSYSDWYVAHVDVGPDGGPVLSHISRAVEAGPHSSAHVMGASAGPDGRAYFVNFESPPGGAQAYLLSTPISVWIQDGGPTLPVSLGAVTN